MMSYNTRTIYYSEDALATCIFSVVLYDIMRIVTCVINKLFQTGR